jgi:hypothetical protein
LSYNVNAPLLAALMRQWEQRVSEALGDDLYFTHRPAWARKYPDVAAGMACGAAANLYAAITIAEQTKGALAQRATP